MQLERLLENEGFKILHKTSETMLPLKQQKRHLELRQYIGCY